MHFGNKALGCLLFLFSGAVYSAPISKSASGLIGSKIETMKYQIFPASNEESNLVVIYFCGGPGIPCTPYGRPEGLPADFHYVSFDYPGLGENESIQGPHNIEGIANAAMIVVNQFTDKNVVFYAQSFGTSIATVVASKLTQTPQSFLKGVILEGVMGPGPHDQSIDLVAAVEKAWRNLSPDEQTKFSASLSALVNQMSSEEAKRFSYAFTIETLKQGTQAAVQNLRSFITTQESGGLAAQLQSYRDLIGCSKTCPEPPPPLPPIESIPLSEWNAGVPSCQVFTSDTASQPAERFYNKTLAEASNIMYLDFCRLSPLKHLQSPWSPADYQIHDTPLVYLNGESDAQTGLNWALEAYASQEGSLKTFIKAKDGGHAVIHDNGTLSACADFFFKNLFSGDFESISAKAIDLSEQGCSALGL